MKVKTCKNLSAAAVVTVLFAAAIPAHCDEHLARANFTQGSDMVSPGLGRIKLLTPGQQNPHAVHSEQRKSAISVSSSAKAGGEEKSPGDPASFHSLEVDDAEKNVNKDLEFRSNSSSLESGIIPSKHSLFADHHNENVPGSHHNSAAEDDETVAAESSAHEHIVRYQQHQSSEEDSEEDGRGPLVPGKNNAHLIHPKATVGEDSLSHPKLADSVVVSSDSFPVRVGPNVRVKGNAFSNRTGGIGIRKPIPVIRHEESVASINADEDRNIEML